MFRRYFEEGLKTFIKEAVAAAVSKRKRSTPSVEEYFSASEEDSPANPKNSRKALRKMRQVNLPLNTGPRTRREEPLSSTSGSLSATKDWGSLSASGDGGVCSGTRRSGVLSGTKENQDSLSLGDIFDANNDDKRFEFTFDPHEGLGTFESSNNDL
ncbi:hypothetical protein NDU88_003006 [Pleurodeles waltl]|uniref:Uncharacterized protein n=1 Tax=Pleurodeles waltl TaxID=8319 RepID=A0AAV7NIN5_PLEWA|nr:hypothetical protein NDU88_003006 [Pleurodeles waltl]